MAYVMIVDDDEDFADATSTILRNAGHEVRIELDTESAVASMQERPPELVLLDVMFPEDPSAGFALARAMRHFNEKLKNIPVLMLTAMNEKFPLCFGPHDIDDNWMPVADFLEKPVDFDLLQSKVDDLLLKTGNSEAE